MLGGILVLLVVYCGVGRLDNGVRVGGTTCLAWMRCAVRRGEQRGSEMGGPLYVLQTLSQNCSSRCTVPAAAMPLQ